MSSDASIDIREVVFVNRAADEAYRGLPDEVRQAADARTTAIQNHRPLPRIRGSRSRESSPASTRFGYFPTAIPIAFIISLNLWR